MKFPPGEKGRKAPANMAHLHSAKLIQGTSWYRMSLVTVEFWENIKLKQPETGRPCYIVFDPRDHRLYLWPPPAHKVEVLIQYHTPMREA